VCQCDEQHRGQRCDHAIVRPSHQTAPAGKDADDPAIWVHPTEPSKSIILGTTKSDRDSGIHSFALDGTHLSFLSGGEPNSVDVLYGFPFGGKNIDIAVAGGRESNTVRVAAIGEDGKLTLLNGGEFDAGIVVYGSGVYHSKKTGAYFVFMNSKKGEVRQFQIFEKEGSAGTLDNLLIKSFKLDSQIEGMVADDDLGYVYVGEEKVGLWRYPAEPNAFDEPVLVDHTNRANGGNMSADIEGVSLFVGKGKAGYIVTSNQGEDSYTLHKRAPPHRFVGSFVIAANDDKGIDGVSHTDGLVVESSRLGPLYPEGALVVHDDETTSPDGTESEATFKIVSWRDIADSVSSKALATFPGRNPRR
jgi:3-phytase